MFSCPRQKNFRVLRVARFNEKNKIVKTMPKNDTIMRSQLTSVGVNVTEDWFNMTKAKNRIELAAR